MTARCRHDGGDGPCDLYPSGECRVRKRAYNASPAGKAAKAAYDASPARKAVQKVYDASPAGKAAKAANALRHHYGLTLEDKRALYEGQKGLCWACKEPITFEESNIDHCHVTGKRRALLHGSCNRMLGFAKDSPAKLEALAAYLRRQGYNEDGTPNFRLSN